MRSDHRTFGSPIERFSEAAEFVAYCVRKRRWVACAAAALVAALAGIAILLISNRYQATARVYVDTQTVLKPLMTGLAFQSDFDQQVKMLARTLISRPNVERLLETPGLHFEGLDQSQRADVVDRLMAGIKIVPTGSENLYEIRFQGTSREQALQVVATTINLFVNSGVGAKKRDSQDAGRFIVDQIRAYETKLAEAENRLKEFKLRNFGISGVSDQDYFAKVSMLSEEVSKLKVEFDAADRKREAFRRELETQEPLLPVELPPSPPVVAEVEKRLEAQRKQLDELLQRFTDRHPDVMSARRIIAELEDELTRRRQAEPARTAAQLPGGKRREAATSPVYQQLRISLADAEAQAASLRAQLSAKQAALNEARSMAGRVPQAQAELAQLNRDYAVIRKTYDEIVARREAAALGSKLDESSQLAEFRVVEPPTVSKSPVFPARWHAAVIAMVLTIVAGVAAAILPSVLRPTVESVAALRILSDRPVLGGISLFVSPEGEHQERAKLKWFALAVAALLMLQAVWAAMVVSLPQFK